MSPHQGLHRVAIVALVALLLGLAACGSEPPTAPRISNPTPPVTPPPSTSVDWDALARLFDDALFLQLPLHLEDQAAGEPLKRAVDELVAGIRIRDIDVALALARITQERRSYALRPGYDAADGALLTAIALFEMRGRSYLGISAADFAVSADGPQ